MRRGSGLHAVTTATALLAVSLSLAAQQADRAHTEALARRAGERLQALQREADALASQEHTLLGDLRRLEVERQIKTEQLKKVDADAAAVDAELAATLGRVGVLERQDLAERPGLRARLVEIYKLGQGRYLRLLFSASDVRRVAQASRTVAALASADHARVNQHQRTLDELKVTRADLEKRRHQLTVLRAETQRAQTAAVRAEQARNALISDIDRRRDLNAQLSAELQAAQQKLQVTLRDVAGGAGSDVSALPIRPFRGDLEWPAGGSVRRRFGRAAGVPGAASNGIEIEAAEGAPAGAVHDGTVAFADVFSGYGNLVILDHGSGAFSLYGNLMDLTVKRGARVQRGQSVGTVGVTPAGSAGLYFELRVDGQPVDPLQWLRKK